MGQGGAQASRCLSSTRPPCAAGLCVCVGPALGLPAAWRGFLFGESWWPWFVGTGLEEVAEEGATVTERGVVSHMCTAASSFPGLAGGGGPEFTGGQSEPRPRWGREHGEGWQEGHLTGLEPEPHAQGSPAPGGRPARLRPTRAAAPGAPEGLRLLPSSVFPPPTLCWANPGRSFSTRSRPGQPRDQPRGASSAASRPPASPTGASPSLWCSGQAQASAWSLVSVTVSEAQNAARPAVPGLPSSFLKLGVHLSFPLFSFLLSYLLFFPA